MNPAYKNLERYRSQKGIDETQWNNHLTSCRSMLTIYDLCEYIRSYWGSNIPIGFIVQIAPVINTTIATDLLNHAKYFIQVGMDYDVTLSEVIEKRKLDIRYQPSEKIHALRKAESDRRERVASILMDREERIGNFISI
jgi:uncharacterized protein (DUF2344 family)